MAKNFPHLATVTLGCLLAAGCHGSGSKDTLDEPATSASGLHAEGQSSDLVDVGRPLVEVSDGVLNVSGHVRRKAGTTATIAGRVNIDVIGPDGAMLVWLPAVLAPNPLPTEGGGEAGYEIHYGWVPPAGSTVRVHFVDAKTAALEDADETEYSGGGAHGGAAGGGTHSGGHSGHSGHSHMMK
jgi:hypothetical protein